MSVIHDVLKNLDASASARQASGVPIFASEKPVRRWLWPVLGVSLLLNMLIVAVYFWPRGNVPLQLPEDIFMAPLAADTTAPAISDVNAVPLSSVDASATAQSDSAEPAPAASAAVPVNAAPAPALNTGPASVVAPAPASIAVQASKPAEKTQQKPEQKSVVQIEKTPGSAAMENALQAVSNGRPVSQSTAAKAMDANENPVVRARLLMAAQPDQVVPYLQRVVPAFMQDADLLSIAAQAEQKQARHTSAAQYYEQLIRLQPNDARWRAGLGISLDAMGNQRDALRLYELALGMGNLPPALMNFLQKRMTAIKN